MLVVDQNGFVYSKENESGNGTSRWSCRKKSGKFRCRSVIWIQDNAIIKQNYEHNHLAE